jgi:hypothetical protein
MQADFVSLFIRCIGLCNPLLFAPLHQVITVVVICYYTLVLYIFMDFEVGL